MADLLVLPGPAKELAEWRRLQPRNLDILGPSKRKEWPQCHRESSWQVRRNRLCQKEKERNRLFREPDHEKGENQRKGMRSARKIEDVEK